MSAFFFFIYSKKGLLNSYTALTPTVFIEASDFNFTPLLFKLKMIFCSESILIPLNISLAISFPLKASIFSCKLKEISGNNTTSISCPLFLNRQYPFVPYYTIELEMNSA